MRFVSVRALLLSAILILLAAGATVYAATHAGLAVAVLPPLS
jgi:hypothetical protein